jgi:dihydroxy-acid dehydratase
MHMVAEALGMALPGSAPVLATSDRLLEDAAQAGRRVVQLVGEALRPREIITAAAVKNAATLVQALGGSVNAVRHLSAIATEARLGIDVVRVFEELDDRVPLLCGVRPNGPHRIEELDEAGGGRALLRELRPLLSLSAKTVAGETMGAVLDVTDPASGTLIHTLEEPYSERCGLLILRGSLAPGGAILKASALPGDGVFEGPAKVFHDEGAAMAALANGEMTSGDVIVLRGLGARGGPGTGFAAGFVAALNGAGLADAVAVVTDGELSGLNRGITVGQVMPEAAEQGPLGVVEQDDRIVIDIDRRSIDLDLPETEIARRLTDAPFERAEVGGNSWLGIYQRAVGPIARGAVLGDVWWDPTPANEGGEPDG